MQTLKDHVTIIAICGMSGSGKDTFARMLEICDIQKKKDRRDMFLISSFTTRPMRTGETNGKEHIFLDAMPQYGKNELFAYTIYGGYEYWTTEIQMRIWNRNIYVVDEVGLKELVEKQKLYKKYKTEYNRQPNGEHDMPWDFDLISIHILRTSTEDIDISRTERDKGRDLSGINFDFEVNNDGTLDDLRSKAMEIYGKITNYKLRITT